MHATKLHCHRTGQSYPQDLTPVQSEILTSHSPTSQKNISLETRVYPSIESTCNAHHLRVMHVCACVCMCLCVTLTFAAQLINQVGIMPLGLS